MLRKWGVIMRYKVFCSNGYEPDIFYCDDKNKAHLLFNMAVSCGFFKYVELAEVIDECFMVREWSSEDEND